VARWLLEDEEPVAPEVVCGATREVPFIRLAVDVHLEFAGVQQPEQRPRGERLADPRLAEQERDGALPEAEVPDVDQHPTVATIRIV